MGILNVTPDSFSDGGYFFSEEKALAHAVQMVEDGAHIIDIGGESTRPGAHQVSEQEEIDRIIPIVEALTAKLPVPLSVDTSKPTVMRAALQAGAGMINDVRALREEGAIEAVKSANVPICLMHMKGDPRTMQSHPAYLDVVLEVKQFLAGRLAICQQAGIALERLIIDPGFGFGKRLEHNLMLLRQLDTFTDFGIPVLVGISRKSMIGTLLSKPAHKRLYGSIAAAVIAVLKGASIVRVHDVRPTVEALTIADATLTGA